MAALLNGCDARIALASVPLTRNPEANLRAIDDRPGLNLVIAFGTGTTTAGTGKRLKHERAERRSWHLGVFFG